MSQEDIFQKCGIAKKRNSALSMDIRGVRKWRTEGMVKEGCKWSIWVYGNDIGSHADVGSCLPLIL